MELKIFLKFMILQLRCIESFSCEELAIHFNATLDVYAELEKKATVS